jgi:hypothetical protein
LSAAQKDIGFTRERRQQERERDILGDLGMDLRKKTVETFTATVTKTTKLTNMLRPYRITGTFVIVYLVA